MGSLFKFASLAALSALLPVVVARQGGGGSISLIVGHDGNFFYAPPLQIANLAAYSIFAFVTLIQLAIALPHLFRSGIRIPASGAVVALVIMAVGYALGAGTIVTLYWVDSFGDIMISNENFIDLDAASNIFFKLGDPAMFVAVALVLHNRYRTVQKRVESAAMIGFTGAATVLVILMIALGVAQEGIHAAVYNAALAEFRGDIPLTEAAHLFNIANNCSYAFVAFHVVSIFFLAVSTLLVKARTENDKIMSLTLFAIVPLLLTHALAQLIFVIVMARLLISRSSSFIFEAEDAIDFTGTLIEGPLHVAAMSVLVFLLARPLLWSAERRPIKATLLQPPQSDKVQTSPQPSSQPSPQTPPAPLHTTDREPV